MCKRKKARRKRWLQARIKSQRKVMFVKGFREHFVKKGIL